MSSSVDTTHPPLFDFSLTSSCTVHNPRTPFRPHASRASRYQSSPVTPRSGLRRTSRLGVTAAPRTCSRYLPWGGGIFAHPHQRACVPPPLSRPLPFSHATLSLLSRSRTDAPVSLHSAYLLLSLSRTHAHNTRSQHVTIHVAVRDSVRPLRPLLPSGSATRAEAPLDTIVSQSKCLSSPPSHARPARALCCH